MKPSIADYVTDDDSPDGRCTSTLSVGMPGSWKQREPATGRVPGDDLVRCTLATGHHGEHRNDEQNARWSETGQGRGSA